MNRRAPTTAIALALFAALAVAFLLPGIFGGQAPVYRDFLILVLPFRHYAAAAVSRWELPLWAPELFLGAPFLANYQSAVLYPPSLIVYLLPEPHGLSLFLAAHLAVAGIGMATYLSRRTGTSPLAALLGGGVFAFGGFLASLLPLTNQLVVAAWLPWALDAAEELAGRRSIRAASRLCVILSFQALGGAPEPLLITLSLVVLRFRAAAGDPRTDWKAGGLLVSSILLSFGVASIQLLPTLEYVAASGRSGGLPLAEAMSESLELRSFVQFLLPHSFRNGGPGFVPEGGIPLVWSLYVGIVPLLLAAIGAIERSTRFWTIAAIVFLDLSLGSNGILLPSLYSLAPSAIGGFRFPVKSFLPVHFALSLLAAHGLDRLAGESSARRRALVLCGFVVLLGVAFSVWARSSPRALLDVLLAETLPAGVGDAARSVLATEFAFTALRSAGVAGSLALLIGLFGARRISLSVLGLAALAISVVDIVAVHRPAVAWTDWASLQASPADELRSPGTRIFHYQVKADPASGAHLERWSGTLRRGVDVAETARALWRGLVPNAPLLYGVGAVAGMDGIGTREQSIFHEVLAEGSPARAVRLLAAFNVSHLVGREPRSTGSTAPVRAERVADPAPRVYLARRTFVAEDVRSALRKLAEEDVRRGEDAVVLAGSRAIAPSFEGGVIRRSAFTSRSVAVDVSLPSAGFLVVADSWAPGWRATVDGMPAEILRANGLARGLELDAGDHRVEMVYLPRSVRWGTGVSSISLAILLISAIVGSRRH